MGKSITFDNGFSAELVYNSFSDAHTLRLYSPSGLQLASVPSDEEHFQAAANGILQGYFAGWRNCKHKLAQDIAAICRQDILSG